MSALKLLLDHGFTDANVPINGTVLVKDNLILILSGRPKDPEIRLQKFPGPLEQFKQNLVSGTKIKTTINLNDADWASKLLEFASAPASG